MEFTQSFSCEIIGQYFTLKMICWTPNSSFFFVSITESAVSSKTFSTFESPLISSYKRKKRNRPSLCIWQASIAKEGAALLALYCQAEHECEQQRSIFTLNQSIQRGSKVSTQLLHTHRYVVVVTQF